MFDGTDRTIPKTLKDNTVIDEIEEINDSKIYTIFDGFTDDTPGYFMSCLVLLRAATTPRRRYQVNSQKKGQSITYF